MAVQMQALKRKFVFNGVELDDPGPDFSVDDVKDALSAAYPDISTAVVNGPDLVGGVAVYTFVRNVGTKG